MSNMEQIKRERRAATALIPPKEFDAFKATCKRVNVPMYEALRQAVAVWIGHVEEAEAAALEEAADRVLAAREAMAVS